MDWTPGGLSDDIEDRRGSSGGGGGFGGGGGLGIVGFIILVIISLVTGRNYIGSYLSGHAVPSQTSAQPTNGYGPGATTASPRADRPAQLVSFVLDDVQRTWTTLLPEQTHRNYRRAKLVLFDNYTRSACGVAQSQTGPFYCPADEKVYIDLSFWNELRRLGGSNAEFAQAYVVAHELGHHVQNILGIEQQVQHLSGQNPGKETGSLSISSCRQTAWPAYGRTPVSSASLFTMLTSQPACGQLLLSATITYRRWNAER
jgi:uncharacterized protein